jgi:hypothetical protein
MEKTNLTQQESLALIEEMISAARNNFRKGGGNGMIFWGISIAAIALLNALLLALLPNGFEDESYLAWLLCVPLVGIDFYHHWKRGRTATVKTHLDAIITTIWQGFLITYAIFIASLFMIYRPNTFFGAIEFVFITPVSLLLCGLCTYATAKACRFKPFVYGTIVFWAGCVAVFSLMLSEYYTIGQFVVLALCMVFGLVVPGILLNKKAEKENV